METKSKTQQELFDFEFVMKILSICHLLPLREFTTITTVTRWPTNDLSLHGNCTHVVGDMCSNFVFLQILFDVPD